MWNYNYSNELYHYGVLGMKWGKRRYQNRDGTLTAKGKQKVNKAYEKESTQLTADLSRTATDRWVKAYNKAADDVNNGLTDKYNEAYYKKLGDKAKDHDYESDEEYNRGYDKMFDKVFSKYMNAETYTEIVNNEHYKKAMELVDEYSMDTFNDLVKQNNEVVNDLKKYTQ